MYLRFYQMFWQHRKYEDIKNAALKFNKTKSKPQVWNK